MGQAEAEEATVVAVVPAEAVEERVPAGMMAAAGVPGVPRTGIRVQWCNRQ